MKIKKEYIALFLISFAFFSIYAFSINNLVGNDGYFFIKYSYMVRNYGLYQEFPWLHDTVLNKNYADMHLLSTFLLIPFTFFDLFFGAKLAVVFFGSLFVATFYFILKKNNIKYPYFWTIALLGSSFYFLRRLLYPRIFIPLAIICMILSIYFIMGKKNKSLFALSFFFSWLYTAAPLVILPAIFYSAIVFFKQRKIDLKPVLYAGFGLLAGMIINPYFPKNFYIYYLQIVNVSFFRPENILNAEWMPFLPFELLSAGFFILALFSVSGFFFINKTIKNRQIDVNKSLVFLLSLFFLMYMLKAKRMIEYFAPFSILFSALVLNDVMINFKGSRKKICLFLVLAAIVLNLGYAFYDLKYYDTKNNFSDCALWLRDNSPKGSLVFIQWWDQMPALYFYNHNNYYTLGFEESFLYLYNKELFNSYKSAQKGNGDVYDIISNKFNSDYVFLYKAEDSMPLFYALEKEDRFILGFRGQECLVYEVD